MMRKNGIRRFMAFIPALLCYGAISVFSSLSLPVSLEPHGADKVVHVAEFGFLGLCLAFGWFRVPNVSLHHRILGFFSSGLLLAGLDEVHQIFVAGRHAGLADALADALGVSLGLLIYSRLSRKPKSGPDGPLEGPGSGL